MCNNNDESSYSKRKALELITNIFRKKSKERLKSWNESENYPPVLSVDSNHDDEVISIIAPAEPRPSTSLQHSTDHLSEFGIPPHSPVSPRVKNINEDMEALTLSRQDNPFIVSKLEKLSSSEEWLSSNSSSLTIQQELLSPSSCSSSTFNMEIEEITSDVSNVHEHLIRSPPPQFPTKLAHFVFPLPNSPIKNLSSRYGSFLSPDRHLKIV
ncbi:uncharacterized protein LOC128387478 [Panonychus citri]|uniref:uncharacterized protein LOC128387478 n=1 Tax=Panonychus citri TaxID=50023 RepID=UPI002307E0CB|nr:uncharacterized protein LOC128387478 [Panonychus citri]